MASTSAKFGFIKGSPIIDVAELPNPVTKSAINPTETYEKIYFNTSLSSDELFNIINSITFIDIGDGEQRYMIYFDSVNSVMLNLHYTPATDTDIGAITIDNAMTATGLGYAIDTSGGVTSTGSYDSLDISLNNGVAETEDIPIGQQNEALKDLIYVEKVDESKINTKALYRLPDGTLWHYFNGQWNAVGGDEKGGTPIKPTGSYDKIYFNTSLSFDAVDNILNNLDYGVNEQCFIYLTIDSSNMPISYIVINRTEDYVSESGYAYSIRVANQSDNILIYNSQNYEGNVKGFRDFINPVNIAFNGGIEILEVEGMTITAGQQNELLKDLVSATPFDNTTNFAILTKRIDSLEARIKALEEA